MISKDEVDQLGIMKECLDNVAHAILDSAIELMKDTRLPISEHEVWNLLNELGVEDGIDETYVFLIWNPKGLRALFACPFKVPTWLGSRPWPGHYRGSSQWERPDWGKESCDSGLGRIGVLSSVVKRVDESGLSGGGFVFLILFLNFNERHHDDCGDDMWGFQRRIEEKIEEDDLVMMHVRCSTICLRRVGMTVALDCIEDGCIEGAWLWAWFAEPKHDRDRNDERGHGASQIFSRGMTEGNDESRMLWLQTRS
ncbi:hypothetical protein Drorol1_Dr00005530 [Drosera rotundifolia]